MADGYITRLPQDLFFGGGGGLAQTRRAMRPDEAAVREVFIAGYALTMTTRNGEAAWP